MALIKLTRVIFLCQSRRVGQAPSADSVMRRANRTVLDPHLTPAVMPLATGDGTASEQGVHGPARVAGRRPTFARCPADAGATVHSTSTCSCSRTLSSCGRPDQFARPIHLWSIRPICPRSSQIGLAELPVILGPIYVIGGHSCWHIYVIQVLKLIKVFGGVLASIYCIIMSFTEEPPKICY
jgi:hypothetical protein